MHLYLKEPNADKETLIIIQYYVKSEGKPFKYSTGEKIHPKNWNFDTKSPLSKKGYEGAKLKTISSIISKYSNFLEEIISNAKINETTISRQYLRDAFNLRFRETKKAEFSFTEFVDYFIEQTPDLINRTTKRKYSDSKVKQYKKTNFRIKDFEGNRKIPLNRFTQSLYDRFVKDCLDNKKYSITYTGDLIKNIKVFHKKAEEMGFEVSQDYKDRSFATMQEESISIALDEKEIESILKHDFSESKMLENCRDLGIIGLWTGLRIGDLLKLPEINPKDDFIEVQPSKTKQSSGAKVVIPLHHHIKEVLNKRGMPHSISDVKFNKYIKLICEEVGITQKVKGSLMNPETNRKEVGMYPKYKLVSSHTCRRSFATNLYKMNFPTLSIMQITGHTTETNFLKYIKVTPREHAQKLLDFWKSHYNKELS